jgi:U3 small nucleolar RNA-associated protein 16
LLSGEFPLSCCCDHFGCVGAAFDSRWGAGGGKRKSEPVGAEPTETQSKNKRRKRSSLEATTQESESKPSSNKKSKRMTEPTEEPEEQQEEEKKPSAAPAAKKHFRFDSEEPEIPEVAAVEDTTESRASLTFA